MQLPTDWTVTFDAKSDVYTAIDVVACSVRTAETHRAHIMQKLRLQTRAQLVRYALTQGLLDEQGGDP